MKSRLLSITRTCGERRLLSDLSGVDLMLLLIWVGVVCLAGRGESEGERSSGGFPEREISRLDVGIWVYGCL
jgi:hypothetical protein